MNQKDYKMIAKIMQNIIIANWINEDFSNGFECAKNNIILSLADYFDELYKQKKLKVEDYSREQFLKECGLK